MRRRRLLSILAGLPALAGLALAGLGRARPAAAQDPAPLPVYDVVSVAVEAVADRPGAVRVVALGRTSTAGWTAPRLAPRGAPRGIPTALVFDFLAVPPPPGRVVAQVLTEIQATITVEQIGARIRSVEVVAERNRVEAPVKSG